ncbi:MAG: NAD(P)H-dependent oxidoreductase [Methylococcales bacterium]
MNYLTEFYCLVANQFVATWHSHHPDATIIVRDLANTPLAHLDAQRVPAFFAQPEARTTEQHAFVDVPDTLIAEIKQADVIIIGLPMYNFGIPSTLKAYFDHIARAGITFKYTEGGSVGLLSGKKVMLFATRGGNVCRNSVRYSNQLCAELPQFSGYNRY